MTSDTPRRSSLAAQSFIFAGRLFTHWRREPMVLIQALLYPTFLLITFKLVIGKSIIRITGTDSLYGLVPMCAVAGAMFGAYAASFNVRFERHLGLVSRMWVLPVHRASPLMGRLLAEATRAFAGAALITAVGIALGLRFKEGWLAVIPFIAVPVIVGVIFSTAVIAIAIRTESSSALIWLMIPSFGAVFSSSGVPPADLLPRWMGPLIHLNPMAPAIGSMRALAEGGPVLWSLLLSLMWALGLAALVGPLALSGYRSAAESGT